MAGVFIPEASVMLMQEDEDDSNRSQTLKINFKTQGAGMYAVLSTKKWSVCDNELNDLTAKINRITKMIDEWNDTPHETDKEPPMMSKATS